jgi:hypothetical protein
MADEVAENDLKHIKVIYKDNSAGIVRASSLQQLIASAKIVAFRRSGGWVKIGRDPVRGLGGRYQGPDRRNPIGNNY